MASDDIVIINQGYELRQSKKTGKTRATIVVKSEPLVHNLDPKALGRPVAQAIVGHLQAKIRGVTARAAEATIEYRKKAKAAFEKGKPWAMKRYSGGKIGAMPPGESETALNDSGRLAKSITGNASSDGAWRINVASNRMSADTSNVQRVFDAISKYVPEILKPELLLASADVQKAIEDGRNNMIQKLESSSTKKAIELVRAGLELFRAGGDFIEGIAG